MACSIHIAMEIYRDNDWELVKGRNELMIEFCQKRINRINSDDAIKLISTFDGLLEEWQKDLEKYQNTPFWIPRTISDYSIFALLSNVRNEAGNIEPFRQGSIDNLYQTNLSVETFELFDDENLHSHTIIYGNEIRDIEEAAAEEFQADSIGESGLYHINRFLDRSFNEPLKMVKDDVGGEHNVRFILAYDN